MPARRRTTTRSRLHMGSKLSEPRPPKQSVSFIGEEIDQAIERIQARGTDLPRWHRLAVKVATVTLRLCKHRIRMAINCGSWGPR